MFCLEGFQMIANGVRKFISFSLQLAVAGFTLFILKKSRFVEDLLFHPKKEVVAFSKIEMYWGRVTDDHVYIESDAVIWFWQYCQEMVCLSKHGASFSSLNISRRT